MVENPKTTYSGLTVILDKLSRFDLNTVLSGYAGAFFDSALLIDFKHGIHRGNVEIRTLDEMGRMPLRADTKCLLLLGEAALQHFNKTGVTLGEQRGSPFTYENKICICSFAPQDAFDRKQYFTAEDSETSDDAEDDGDGKSTHGKTRRKNWKFWLRQDIRKAVRLTRQGLINNEPDIRLYPSAQDVIDRLLSTKNQTLYFDIETDSCLQLTCFGFTFGEGAPVYVVPMVQTHFNPRKYYYDDITTAKILRALSVALCSNTVVIHNAMFDLFVLAWRYRLPIGSKVYDTMLSHSRCYIEVEKSLGHCISLYTDLPYHKNEGVFEPHNSQQAEMLYRYNGKDVYAMTLLKPAINERARTLGAVESVEQVNRLVIPYLTSTLQGMRVNWSKVATLVGSNDRMQDQINRILAMLTGKATFNSNSWQQVSEYLYEDLSIPKPKEDPTAEKTLLELLLKYEVPAIHAILEYRKLTKQSSKVSFYPYRGLYHPDRYNKDNLASSVRSEQERFTCSYNLAGTTTMRLSSRKLLGQKGKKVGTYFGGWGDNAQNFEKGLRKIITPDIGKVLGQNDQSGAEALIVSYLCRYGKFRELFLHGIKPHVFVALHVFAEQWSKMPDKVDNNTLIRALVAEPKDLKNVDGWKKLEAVIKDSDNWEASKRYYFIAKMICHASNYGMKARMFRINVLQKSDGAIVKTVQECEQMLTKYHTLFPEIREWHDNVIAQVRKTSVLKNLFGHPRIFTGHQDESAYKEWFAFVPQSTVGQITNYAFTELQEGILAGEYTLDFDVLENNHDSILWQSLPENRDKYAKVVNDKLCRRLVSPRGEEFFMKSEAQWSSESWGSMLEIKL